MALAAGVAPLAAAARLETVALPPHRRRCSAARAGRTILDDCYNANPASMSAALAAVVAAVGGAGGGRAFAVLGDMLELGPEAEALHRALGREAGVRLAGVVALGDFAGAVVDGARAAGLAPSGRRSRRRRRRRRRRSRAGPTPGDWILVKASRGMRLERVIDALAAALPAHTRRQHRRSNVERCSSTCSTRCASGSPGANVFRYVSTRIGLATLTSLLITFIVAPWFIRRARERQLGEVIRDDGPAGARVEEGDADDGRRAHHHGAGGRHGAVVRPAQHAGVAGAAGDRRATAPSASSTTT